MSQVKADSSEFLTAAQLAKRLQVTESWVHSKCRARCKDKIPVIRLGRYRRFSWDAVAAWLRGRSS